MILPVRVIPNAARTGITGKRDGEFVLRVNAPALDGRANRSAAVALAKLFGVPPSRVLLVKGEKSRHKKFEIVGLGISQQEALLDDLLKAGSS